MDAAALIADLDDEQCRAVTASNRLVAVIAGAGSGKTRVLTRRVAYRIAIGEATPAHTLVLTFTREAAAELRRRLTRLGIDQPIAAGTFHSVGRQLLQQRWTDRGERPPTITSDRNRLLSEALRNPGDLFDIRTEIDYAASQGWSGADYLAAVNRGLRRPRPGPQRVRDAIEQYQHAKRERHVIDLDDLVRLATEALEQDPTFADATRWRFRHLLVDEAQDLNPLQQRLVDSLRRGADDLFLVGDPDQAIFGFNGSDPTLLRDVATRFPGVEVIRLPTNHRSTPQIVAAGEHVLRSSGHESYIRTDRDDGPTVSVIEHASEDHESIAVAAGVSAVDLNLLRRSDVAVLARTHATLDACREALLVANIPVRHLAAGPSSPIAPHLRALYRFTNPHEIRTWAQDHREEADETGDATLAAVVNAALDFLREQPTGTGANLASWVDLTNPFGEQVAGVELATFHAAKGREWHTVFIIGCETSLVPHRSATTNAGKTEEARLLYVAATRATDRLVINWSARRGGYQRKISPFINGFVSRAAPSVRNPMSMTRSIDHPSPQQERLERLERWRSRTARRAGILPTQVVSDQALQAIAHTPPATADDLRAVSGLGPIAAARHFPAIADALT